MSYQTHADLGGQTGHGAVLPEPESELWHAAWEPRALALTLAAGATGAWNIDQSRAARETLPDYARLGYYQIWLAALQKLLAERGLVGDDEIQAGHALRAANPAQLAQHIKRVLGAADVSAALAKGSATQRPPTTAARFALGDRVKTITAVPLHHTRLPAYARGKLGVVRRVHGTHVFADANAQGLGEQPQWLYGVEFDGATLWGDSDSGGGNGGGQAGVRVSIDAWEPYLESAP